MKKVIAGFKIVGDMCAALSRRDGVYLDRTGNLRSSVGYGIFQDSSLIFTWFYSNS